MRTAGAAPYGGGDERKEGRAMRSLPYLIILSPVIVVFAIANRIADATAAMKRSRAQFA